ncbi:SULFOTRANSFERASE [Salix purpurea]|uniref:SULFOTRANSFERASE n=1 Tax=Salix purpurea TaxID=77065 RepID=A0A9Q0ZW35_SALPP|nr:SULFOTRANSFERASE [Salix purpurea]
MSKINESPNTNSKYEKIISNLPQDDGWKPVGNLYKYQGFWYGPSLLRNVISAQESFTPRPSDIVLCSSPKSGLISMHETGDSITVESLFFLISA